MLLAVRSHHGQAGNPTQMVSIPGEHRSRPGKTDAGQQNIQSADKRARRLKLAINAASLKRPGRVQLKDFGRPDEKLKVRPLPGSRNPTGQLKHRRRGQPEPSPIQQPAYRRGAGLNTLEVIDDNVRINCYESSHRLNSAMARRSSPASSAVQAPRRFLSSPRASAPASW